MGNRAVIKLEECPKVGIYLHWNGGRDSVEAFLQTAKDYGIRCDDYGVARLAQIIGNAIGGTLSVGVNAIENLDCANWDNGLYIVKDWEIVGREHFEDREEQNEHSLEDAVAWVKEKNQSCFEETEVTE